MPVGDFSHCKSGIACDAFAPLLANRTPRADIKFDSVRSNCSQSSRAHLLCKTAFPYGNYAIARRITHADEATIPGTVAECNGGVRGYKMHAVHLKSLRSAEMGQTKYVMSTLCRHRFSGYCFSCSAVHAVSRPTNTVFLCRRLYAISIFLFFLILNTSKVKKNVRVFF